MNRRNSGAPKGLHYYQMMHQTLLVRAKNMSPIFSWSERFPRDARLPKRYVLTASYNKDTAIGVTGLQSWCSTLHVIPRLFRSGLRAADTR